MAIIAFVTGDQPALSELSSKPAACHFFTYENAAKIIGQKAKGIDGDEAVADGGRQWSCTFTAASGEGGPRIYFLLIRNSSEEAARQAFYEIRQSNKNHAGFEDWPGIGDEAIVQTDGTNFQFVMIRKGAKTIRLKVNPSAGVSFDDVKTVAASLSMKMK